GGTPSTLTSRVLEMTPKAMPSAPSTSWAAKPTAMNGSKAAKSRSAQFMQSPPLRSAQELLLLFSTQKIENHSPAEARLFRPNCGLSAAKAEVPYFVAQAPGLRFVTSLGPAGRAVLPTVGPFDEPFEPVGMPAHHHQRVAQINGVIGPEAELPAGLQLGGEQRHRPIVHHPPLRMARLGPGVGMEQVEERQRAVRHAA